jgi:hypothetical protein
MAILNDVRRKTAFILTLLLAVVFTAGFPCVTPRAAASASCHMPGCADSPEAVSPPCCCVSSPAPAAPGGSRIPALLRADSAQLSPVFALPRITSSRGESGARAVHESSVSTPLFLLHSSLLI